ncbi:hypothetical protein D3C71_1650150 [compost metagenome]
MRWLEHQPVQGPGQGHERKPRTGRGNRPVRDRQQGCDFLPHLWRQRRSRDQPLGRRAIDQRSDRLRQSDAGRLPGRPYRSPLGGFEQVHQYHDPEADGRAIGTVGGNPGSGSQASLGLPVRTRRKRAAGRLDGALRGVAGVPGGGREQRC